MKKHVNSVFALLTFAALVLGGAAGVYAQGPRCDCEALKKELEKLKAQLPRAREAVQDAIAAQASAQADKDLAQEELDAAVDAIQDIFADVAAAVPGASLTPAGVPKPVNKLAISGVADIYFSNSAAAAVQAQLAAAGIADARNAYISARRAHRAACADLDAAEAALTAAEDALSDLEEAIAFKEMDLLACGCH